MRQAKEIRIEIEFDNGEATTITDTLRSGYEAKPVSENLGWAVFRVLTAPDFDDRLAELADQASARPTDELKADLQSFYQQYGIHT